MILPQPIVQLSRPGGPITWYFKAGKGHRIDFVGLPRSWSFVCGSVGPESGVDVSDGDIDHSLVVVSCVAVVVRGKVLLRRRANVCDLALLSRADRAALLHLESQHAPVLPWRGSADGVVTVAKICMRL